MAKKKKDLTEPPSAMSLLEEPLRSDDEPRPSTETPFDKTYNILTALSGARLELMTRTTRQLASAINMGYSFTSNFHSAYVQGRLDTLMRIHVSMGGKGRAEMVQSLQAGSGVSDAFYDQGNPTMHSFVDMPSEREEESDGGD